MSTLLKIMVDPSAPSSTRVRAADRILGRAKQAMEFDDIQARLDALERRAELANAPERVSEDSRCGTYDDGSKC